MSDECFGDVEKMKLTLFAREETARVTRLEDLLRDAEWNGEAHAYGEYCGPSCPWCGGTQFTTRPGDEHVGHEKGCAWVAAMLPDAPVKT